MERLREISRLGMRDMGQQASLLQSNACEKRAKGVLWVLGEQPIRQVLLVCHHSTYWSISLKLPVYAALSY